ncbi:MAG TPA: delta-60 repeat domain-containing protein, partial [Verrucomicrobiae bacterium]|nr:delta-60 repeat domain-containing protein [Verrucomicrobiae bacterium]
FTQFNGTALAGIGRLNSDGSVDTSFNPGAGATGINTLLVQSNGKVVVGGGFSKFNGAAAGGITRLDTNGAVDPTFDIGTGISGGFVPRVSASLLQADGKIVIGGDFSVVNGVSVNDIARLNGDPVTATKQPARFQSISVTGTSVQLTISGKAGQSYSVQASTDLVSWSPLQVITAPTDIFTVTASTTGHAYQFYRAVTQ